MPATKRDYYEVLQVTKTATEVEIKKSYRRLAMKYHPDRNGGDAEAEVKFRECAEAYEVLSDAGKRQRYDQFGHQGVQGSARNYQNVDVSDIFDMFGDIFGFGGMGGGRGGRGGRQAGPRKGANLETQIELTLEEVAAGAEKTIEFERDEVCDVCDGDGTKEGASRTTCATCGGQGRVAQQGLGGMFRMVTTCPTCRGRGTQVDPADLCKACRGTGTQTKDSQVTVKVPAGVHEGQAVRVPNQGQPGEDGAPAGDLICYIVVRPHEVFSRHNNDLVCQVPLSFSQAALGAELDVPSLGLKDSDGDGPATATRHSSTLEIPRGTQHGEIFKMKGKGLPDVQRYGRGDLVVQVLVEIPKKLTSKQEELLREFAATEARGDGEMPQRKSFMDKVKTFFGGDE